MSLATYTQRWNSNQGIDNTFGFIPKIVLINFKVKSRNDQFSSYDEDKYGVAFNVSEGKTCINKPSQLFYTKPVIKFTRSELMRVVAGRASVLYKQGESWADSMKLAWKWFKCEKSKYQTK